MENAQSGFRKTGICPLNPNALSNTVFAPSLTTDIALPTAPQPGSCEPVQDVIFSIPDMDTLPPGTEVVVEICGSSAVITDVLPPAESTVDIHDLQQIGQLESAENILDPQQSGQLESAENILDPQQSGQLESVENILDLQQSGQLELAENIHDPQQSGQLESAENIHDPQHGEPPTSQLELTVDTTDEQQSGTNPEPESVQQSGFPNPTRKYFSNKLLIPPHRERSLQKNRVKPPSYNLTGDDHISFVEARATKEKCSKTKSTNKDTVPRGGATVLKVGGDNFASGASKKIFLTPPLFGQWGGGQNIA